MNDATGNGAPLLRLRGVAKHFGPVQALSGVDLDIPAGRVTALVGDNGAGKSTLIKSISGIWGIDGGEMQWKGDPVHLTSPRDAAHLGIATVYQDLALCDNLDIVANMFLGRELRARGLLDEPDMERTAGRTLSDLSVTTVKSLRQLVGSLSVGQRQAVAALGVSQTEMVLELVKQLRDRGIAVLIISHNLNDVFAVADIIAVLYLGRLARSGPVGELDSQSVVELITTGSTSQSPATQSTATHSPATEG